MRQHAATTNMAGLPDEVLWFLSKPCATCHVRALDIVPCARCQWAYYCSSAHRQSDAPLHSQTCTLPHLALQRTQTLDEIAAERAALVELAGHVVLPRSRLRESQQRRLNDWGQWFFVRGLQVRHARCTAAACDAPRRWCQHVQPLGSGPLQHCTRGR